MAWELLAAIQSTLSVWEDAKLKVRTLVHTKRQILTIFPQDFVANLPNYCAHGVLRSPTMWLGIFTGGFVFIPVIFIRFNTNPCLQVPHTHPHDVPRPRSHTHGHLFNVHHLLAPPYPSDVLPTYGGGRCHVRLFQTSCRVPAAH